MNRCSRQGQRVALQGGFALVAVLVLVAVLGLWMGAAAQIESTTTLRSREAELLAIGREMRAAIGRYHDLQAAGRTKEYPARLEDLLQDTRTAGMVRHLRSVRTDPMTGRAEWGLVRVAGRIVGVHSLSEGRPLKVSGFDGDDAGFANQERYSDWKFVHAAAVVAAPPGAGASASTAASAPTPR